MLLFILDEPNNFGGKVPGEDCAVAGLWSEDMAWYDVPCIIRGFAISKETTASFNPLCQHEKFTKEKYTWDVEGLNEVGFMKILQLMQCAMLDV